MEFNQSTGFYKFNGKNDNNDKVVNENNKYINLSKESLDFLAKNQNKKDDRDGARQQVDVNLSGIQDLATTIGGEYAESLTEVKGAMVSIGSSIKGVFAGFQKTYFLLGATLKWFSKESRTKRKEVKLNKKQLKLDKKQQKVLSTIQKEQITVNDVKNQETRDKKQQKLNKKINKQSVKLNKKQLKLDKTRNKLLKKNTSSGDLLSGLGIGLLLSKLGGYLLKLPSMLATVMNPIGLAIAGTTAAVITGYKLYGKLRGSEVERKAFDEQVGKGVIDHDWIGKSSIENEKVFRESKAKDIANTLGYNDLDKKGRGIAVDELYKRKTGQKLKIVSKKKIDNKIGTAISKNMFFKNTIDDWKSIENLSVSDLASMIKNQDYNLNETDRKSLISLYNQKLGVLPNLKKPLSKKDKISQTLKDTSKWNELSNKKVINHKWWGSSNIIDKEAVKKLTVDELMGLKRYDDLNDDDTKFVDSVIKSKKIGNTAKITKIGGDKKPTKSLSVYQQATIKSQIKNNQMAVKNKKQLDKSQKTKDILLDNKSQKETKIIVDNKDVVKAIENMTNKLSADLKKPILTNKQVIIHNPENVSNADKL